MRRMHCTHGLGLTVLRSMQNRPMRPLRRKSLEVSWTSSRDKTKNCFTACFGIASPLDKSVSRRVLTTQPSCVDVTASSTNLEKS